MKEKQDGKLLKIATPRVLKIFYGWWIVAAALSIAIYVGGVVFYGFTSVFQPIADEMGWSYTQISLAMSLRGMESGITAPLVGVLVDRWGPRKLIFGGSIIAAVGLILVSLTHSLVMFYGAFLLMTIGTSCCSQTCLATAVGNWFHKKVGLATGIAVSGFGFSGLIIPLMVKMIEVMGWRMTMAVLGGGMFVLVLPLALVFRHKPEQYGYLPDGAIAMPAAATAASTVVAKAAPSNGLKVRDVVKDSTFWRICVIFMFNILLVNAAVTHVMPYLEGQGIARELAGLVAMFIPLSSVLGRLSFGWLGDRLGNKPVAAFGFVMTSIGMLCFAYVSQANVWLIIPFLLLFGVGFGGLNPL